MRSLQRQTSTLQFRRAFTLIELVVVLVLLAIMAALTVPRMLGNDKRQFRLAVEQVGDLLTMYSQRQMLAQKVVGLMHDRRENRLMLVVLDTEGLSDSRATWLIDRYVQPVALPAFMLDTDVTIYMNGEAIDCSEYPLSSEIGQERPWIDITLRGAGESASLSLTPTGVAPMISAGPMSQGTLRTAYDLDNTGRSREDW
jgi:prepilin-type N-terminal cleavage/methylation domain-containing protein